MDSFDKRMQLLAQRNINKRGKTIAYSLVTQGVYNPAVGAAVAAIQTVSVKAIVKAPSGANLAPGTLVQENSRVVTLAALDMPRAPAPGDSLTVDGAPFMVTGADPVYAGELVATWMIAAKAG